MPDLYDMGNLLEKGYQVANKAQMMDGLPSLDEKAYVMGFMACFGIITRVVDIGLAADASYNDIFDNIHRCLVDYGRKVVASQPIQDEVRRKMNEGGIV